MTTISGVNTLRQHGKEIFFFKLSAHDLLKHGVVQRLADSRDEDGAIQRDFMEGHARGIGKAMVDPDVLWPDTIIIAFREEPKYANGTLILPDNYKFLIDEGQHRFAALKAIKAAGLPLPDIEFVIYATYGFTLAERVALFKLQARRKPVTRDFALALSAKADDYTNPSERRAHAVVIRLGTDKDSPMRGLIGLPKLGRPSSKACWLGTSLLVRIFQGAFARGRGPWEKLSEDEVVTAVKVYMRAIIATWPTAWEDPNRYALKSNRALVALLHAFAADLENRELIKSYTEEVNIRGFVRAFETFDWSARARSNQNTRIIGNAIAVEITMNQRGLQKIS